MPGFMDNYLANGREEEQNMFDPYSDMNYMGQEHQDMGMQQPMASPGQDPRKKNKWAAYFQQMLGKGGQVDPMAERAEQQQQRGMGAGASPKQYSPDPMQRSWDSNMQQGQQVGQGIRKLFGG